jgi:hypothetical protein
MYFASKVLYVLKQMYVPSICRIQTELHFTMMLIVDSKLSRNRFVEVKCKNSVEGDGEHPLHGKSCEMGE